MTFSKINPKEVLMKDRAAWHDWLAAHFGDSEGIWLVYYKKDAGKGTLTYQEIVEEALCFGWIDSIRKRVDEKKTKMYMSPRKAKSVWSSINKNHVKKLEKAGLMTEWGRQKITAAKKDGSWDALNDIEKLIIPPDLEIAFNKNKAAKEFFLNMSVSMRKITLHWLSTARTEETRNKRIREIIEKSAKKERVY